MQDITLKRKFEKKGSQMGHTKKKKKNYKQYSNMLCSQSIDNKDDYWNKISLPRFNKEKNDKSNQDPNIDFKNSRRIVFWKPTEEAT